MKNYYVVCVVNYTMNDDEGKFDGEELYTFIVNANTESKAKEKAKTMALNQFEVEINDEFENIKATIDECYETSSDARC